MSDEKEKTERTVHTIAAVVDDNLYQGVDNLKWELRMSMSEIMRQALSDFVSKHGR